MREFTKFKVGVALALLGVLFTLQPLLSEIKGFGFLFLGFSLQLSWFFHATSVLLGLSVYLYALALVREQPPRGLESAGNVVYASALAVPPLFALLWVSSLFAIITATILKQPWARQFVSGLLGAGSAIAGFTLSRMVARVLTRRDKTARVDQLQTAEVFHLDRAQQLYDTAHYDLSVLESFRAVEAALTAALEVRDVRPPRPVALFDAAVNAELVSREHRPAYDELRALRNNAVHKATPISAGQALKALTTARVILGVLTREWPSEPTE